MHFKSIKFNNNVTIKDNADFFLINKADIDISKKSQTVEVNVDKNGKKNKVKIGLRGIKVEDEEGEKVNIQFIPIFLFILAVLGGFLFFIYKVLELLFS